MSTYCNNCGKNGHLFHQCKSPIISYGLIVFRENPNKQNAREYLLIKRRDTLGFVDFMRGKYSIYNKKYILNMIKQMTNDEKNRLINNTFSKLWEDLWGGQTDIAKIHCLSENDNIDISSSSNEGMEEWMNGRASAESQPAKPYSRNIDPYKAEEQNSRNKFESLKSGIYAKTECYTLEDLIQMTEPIWTEPEWGFPKGRRNYQERDYDCAVREFCEETGYSPNKLIPLKNIQPFEEIFIGSNYKSYKHKYYVTYMKYDDTLSSRLLQECEVSESSWMTVDKCETAVRSYNVEKKRVLLSVDKMLSDNYLSNNFRM